MELLALGQFKTCNRGSLADPPASPLQKITCNSMPLVMSRYRLLLAVGGLILYGSLYPFDFTAPAPDGLQRFLTNWQLYTSRGDMLDNILLFVPWGLFGMLTLGAKRRVLVASGLTLSLGLVLSIGAQVLQVWLPTRNAAVADVLANAVGIVVGGVIGQWMSDRPNDAARIRQRTSLPALLLVGFVLIEWLPLVPGLDLQLVKNQLKALWNGPPLSFGDVSARMAFGLLAGYLLAAISGLRLSLVLLPAVLVAVLIGKLFLYGSGLDRSSILGLSLGCGAWWLLARQRPAGRDVLALVGICVFFTLGALMPLTLRQEAAPVSWVPFAAMLKGSMLSNLRALLTALVLFTGILYIFSRHSRKVVAASVVLAAWVAFIELLQTRIEGRTPDITQALLALLAGQLIAAWLDRQLATAAPGTVAAVPGPGAIAPPLRRRGIWQKALSSAVGAGALAVVMHQLLRIPGIPYNMRELFRADGSVWALIAFSAALLWIGAGSVWLVRTVWSARVPALRLPPTTLLTALVSLLFLWSGVTTESIEDISGSANVYWFVTNKDSWGATWREVFLWTQAPGLISFLEHCVRYSALYAPLPLMLGLMIAVLDRARWPAGSMRRSIPLLCVALLLMWLCKTIAFDWTSTDNLNELIARDGPWGWGGGGYLYALVALLCLNGMLVGEVLRARHLGWTLAGVPVLLISVPLGWWLLNQGLEQRVEKYGQVFSGTQFLLGPDRTHTMSQQVLFLRWAVLHLGAMVILGMGLWLGHQTWMGGANTTSRIGR